MYVSQAIPNIRAWAFWEVKLYLDEVHKKHVQVTFYPIIMQK